MFGVDAYATVDLMHSFSNDYPPNDLRCAALVTLYGILLPPAIRPAILEVIIKEPPSVLVFKVFSAALNRKIWDLTLTA